MDADSNSDMFDVIEYPSTVYLRDSEVYVSYHVAVVNASADVLEGVQISLQLDPELDQYLAAGVPQLSSEPVDLFAMESPEVADGTGARGIDFVSDQPLATAEFMNDAGLDPTRISSLTGALVVVSWNGGEESLEYEAPVLDPDGLLVSYVRH